MAKRLLVELQEKRCMRGSTNDTRKVQRGDIVILKRDGTPPCLWKLAKVIETIEG